MVNQVRVELLEKCYAMSQFLPAEYEADFYRLVLDMFTEAEIEYWTSYYVTVH